MKHKDIKKFSILLYIIYILSIIFFLFNKEFGKSVISLISLIITFVLTKAYLKNLAILDYPLYIIGNIFILSSFLLGSCYGLYDIIPFYDDFLHFWSGFISVKIGFNILKNISSKNNKLLICMILFFFAMGISAICEICEYLLDVLFKMNTQSGGLKDTMIDLIDASCGAFFMIVYYYRKYLR
ncbi:hypothetical protein PN279_10785 [Romboutsia sp. 1001216sp1]|uniref:hypothetical protein n=1 Tax=unclassified Romboutsia TaxID=2626894 RepID=UPI0018A8A6F4|nr:MULTISPECIES: hypothetical protein [unclassified Romboutsia]MDB8797045.1 hypothetical protein [Romboutsia sp. 1001216sp1]